MGLQPEGTKGKVPTGKAEGRVWPRAYLYTHVYFTFLWFCTVHFVVWVVVVPFYQKKDGFWTDKNNAMSAVHTCVNFVYLHF